MLVLLFAPHSAAFGLDKLGQFFLGHTAGAELCAHRGEHFVKRSFPERSFDSVNHIRLHVLSLPGSGFPGPWPQDLLATKSSNSFFYPCSETFLR